jgi:succinoglycan biosynthesis protein ExoA
MSELASVSVVIPCRNEAGHIRRFLDSLLAQEAPGIDLEVIIADGMSDDGTREILREYGLKHPHIRTLNNPEKTASTGLNTAIGCSHGEIIIRMDVHSEYAPDYIGRCVEVLEATGADNVGGPARTRAHGVTARAIAAAYHSPFSCGGARFHNPEFEGPVDTVPYGCWRRDCLERLGLFDETLLRNQDDELNLRLIRSGGVIWQSPAIISWYRPRASLPNLFRQYFQYGFWKVAVIRKHRLPASVRHLVPGAFVLANLALLFAAAVSPYSRELLLLWALIAGLYGACCVAASLQAARRHGWSILPLLPVVFPVFHFSYGLGFVAGLSWHALARPGRVPGHLFSGLSR